MVVRNILTFYASFKEKTSSCLQLQVFLGVDEEC